MAPGLGKEVQYRHRRDGNLGPVAASYSSLEHNVVGWSVVIEINTGHTLYSLELKFTVNQLFCQTDSKIELICHA